MVVLPINRIEIDFPFTPYGSQIQYMSKVIDALRNGHNALLESPTGTGKTLCLLCAALAWRSTYVAALQASLHNSLTAKLAAAVGLTAQPTSAGDALEGLMRPGANVSARVPRIVYASRTHSQLAQAVHELQRTIYRPGMVMLASRDQLCIHDISRVSSGSRLNARCRKITSSARRQCRFHIPVASPRQHENRCEELVEKLHNEPAMDIEDLRDFGMKEGACPWFLSRAASQAESCEIIFLPYNYLLDRNARSSLDIDWSNDIVIIDEAHNLESICADAASFDLTKATRAGCESELTKCLQQGLNPMGITIPALENLAKTKEGMDAVLGTENRDMLEFRIMRSVLAKIEEFVDNIVFKPQGTGNIEYAVFPPSDFRNLLDEVNGPTSETFELFVELLDRAINASSAEENLPENGTHISAPSPGRGNNPLQLLQKAIRILFETVLESREDSFCMVVHQDKARQKGRTLSYWCFDSSIAMKNLQALGLRCMLLTSGTLSPLSTFATELGLSFPVRLENPHVITRNQVLAGVVKEGPRFSSQPATKLSSAYRVRGEATQLALGRTILQVARVVPDGLLVFFPSYSTMHSSIDVWKQKGPGPTGARPSVWELFLRQKMLVVEERESHELSAAVLAHRTNVDSGNGSILFAVCRGKVSEGIDFSDEYGRAVIITGLPYPSAADPKVKLKREMADKRFRALTQRSAVASGDHVLSGSEWYTVQAIRAVNQAVGRAIRHRNDYGVVLLCDERFAALRIQDQLSKWIRPHIKVFGQFQGVQENVEQFFEYAKNAPFSAASNTKRALAASLQQTRDSRDSRREGNCDAVLLAQETIARIVPKQISNEELFAKVEELTEQATAMRKRTEVKKTDLPDAILPWTSTRPVSGISSVSLGSRGEAAKSASVPSLSAQFLASRARKTERNASQEKESYLLESRKGSSVQTPIMKKMKLSKAGKAAPLSQRAKSVLKSKDDLRKFLTILRRILATEKQSKEGLGPLQNGEEQRMEAVKEGLKATKEIVRFTRRKTEDSGQCGIVAREQFLHDMRERIPRQFREVYDAALQHSSKK